MKSTGRTFVIGDIHGALKALIQVIERAEVKEDDLLIFLGDYVDGWSQSPEVINYLIQLKDTHNCIFNTAVGLQEYIRVGIRTNYYTMEIIAYKVC